MTKLTEFLKRWRWYIAAYFAYFTIFWFTATPVVRLSNLEAYFALLLLHAFFGLCVWAVRRIAGRD